MTKMNIDTGEANVPRDLETAEMFPATKTKGAIKPVKGKKQAAPGDGEGPGWKDAPSPKERAAARKKSEKEEVQPHTDELKKNKAAQAKKKAAKAKATPKAKAEPKKSAAKPKAKPAPAPKAKAKPEAQKAPRAKQTRGVEKQAILIRVPVEELAAFDKARPADESRSFFALRIIREQMKTSTEAKKAARKKA